MESESRNHSHEIKRGAATQMRSHSTAFEACFPETGQAVYARRREFNGSHGKLGEVGKFQQFAEEKMFQTNGRLIPLRDFVAACRNGC